MGWSGLLAGGGFPRWLSTIAVIGGVGALVMGIFGFLHWAVAGVLVNVVALIATVWVLAACVLVWRAPGGRAVELVEYASPA